MPSGTPTMDYLVCAIHERVGNGKTRSLDLIVANFQRFEAEKIKEIHPDSYFKNSVRRFIEDSERTAELQRSHSTSYYNSDLYMSLMCPSGTREADGLCKKGVHNKEKSRDY